MNDLHALIRKIADFSAPNVFNPWADTDTLDLPGCGFAMRRRNLMDHFSCRPEYVLIGEAPGYQGCHFSGVAFTNEKLICSGQIPRVNRSERFTGRETPWSEPAATVVWKALHELKIASRTVLWNAFAWHPYQHGCLYTNRPPTKQELNAGKDTLNEVIEYFRSRKTANNLTPVTIVAVGKVAEYTLSSLNVKYDYAVRHPSMGGATIFRRQMQELTGL